MRDSEQFRKLIEVVGHQSAVRLARKYGGSTYTTPSYCDLHDLHPLVIEIGFVSAAKMCHTFDRIYIPLEVNAARQMRDDHIREQYCSGVSISEISRALQLDRKAVQNILADMGVRETVDDNGRSQGDRSQGGR
jgi:hypothetical protein